MKKFLVVALITRAVCIPTVTFAVPYGGGSGTEQSPYEIWTPEQMNTIGLHPEDWNKHFKLMANIDMSIYTGTQYNIIGSRVNPAFTGSFDGNGYVIRNLSYTKMNYNPSDIIRAGVFGTIGDGGRVRNVCLEKVEFSCGYVLTLGGLAGENLGMITACRATGSVGGVADSIGGLVGSDYGLVINSYCDCAVSGAASVNTFVNVGGLIGYEQFGLRNCFAIGPVSSADDYARIGGLVGDNAGSLTACYATGSVTGFGSKARVGGLVGNTGMLGSIKSCYATGPVRGNYYTGGLAGTGNSTYIAACFWDVQTSGTADGVGNLNPDPEGVIGLDTAEMMTLPPFIDAGWDFTNECANGTKEYWRMCVEGVDYPRLNWDIGESDFACPNGVNIEDLDSFIAWWLKDHCTLNNNYCGGTDLDFSGAVDLADLSILAADWINQ